MMNVARRDLLAGTAGLVTTVLGGRKLAAANPRPDLDPKRATLPTPDQQAKGLDADALAAQTKPRQTNKLPVTGLPLRLDTVDDELSKLVKTSGLVGVSFALAVNRQLMVTRGYGHLCSHDRVPVTPTHPGYIGSITKPLCAMTALTLVKAGKLKLDQKVVDVLPTEPLLKPGEKRQPEIDQVSVRMLMNHTSGLFNVVEELFDREYYRQLAAAGKLKLVHGDISQYDLVRRGMAKPFVAIPGAGYSYSGQAFQVLGRIVEKLTGVRLDDALSSELLAHIGVKRHTTLSYLDPTEFEQIAAGHASKTHSFIPSPYSREKNACQSWAHKKPTGDLYGHHWGQADACGASMLSAVDLLRFVTFCTDPLGKELATEALTPPKQKPYSNGLGWGVSMTSGRHQYGHGGAFSGIRAFCESTWDGVQYAVLAAGDRDEPFSQITKQVLALGRELRQRKAAAVGWQKYGFT